jgi:hypothetical protein
LTTQLVDCVLAVPPDHKDNDRQNYDEENFHEDELPELYSASRHGSEELSTIDCLARAGMRFSTWLSTASLTSG